MVFLVAQEEIHESVANLYCTTVSRASLEIFLGCEEIYEPRQNLAWLFNSGEPSQWLIVPILVYENGYPTWSFCGALDGRGHLPSRSRVSSSCEIGLLLWNSQLQRKGMMGLKGSRFQFWPCHSKIQERKCSVCPASAGSHGFPPFLIVFAL